MQSFGGALSRLRTASAVVALLLAAGGCVRQAVLENDVQGAQWKARALATATDLNLAEAALSAQLVELEALYQRDQDDQRVLGLLDRGYTIMAQGFIEARRLDALAAGDTARAAREARLQTDAQARARFYGAFLTSSKQPARPWTNWSSILADAELACRQRDLAAYEKRLNGLLAQPEGEPERRLELALLRRLASAWLMPKVAARCNF